jgi:hypothetical protein
MTELTSRRAILIRFIGLTLFSFLSVLQSHSQKDTTELEHKDQKLPARYISLFNSDEILEISLSLDLATFLKKTDKTQSFDGEVTFHFSETDSIDRKVTVKYRGVSRFERCKFPPMKITFKKPLYEGPDSGKIKSIKLVSPCQQGVAFEQYVIREWLVYKLYNVMTDTSYRARLLKVNLVDSEKKRKPIEQYGIFIEPDDLLEERENILEVKNKGLSQRHMYPAMIDRVAIFNYMVSNWDWSVPGQHNVRVFTSPDPTQGGWGIPVPYDFDLTGVVNAEYAIPPPDLGIESNRNRMFTGICRSREEYRAALMDFLALKEEFYSVVNGCQYLSNPAKRDITGFLDQFFDQIEKEKSLNNLIDLFLDNCKKL